MKYLEFIETQNTWYLLSSFKQCHIQQYCHMVDQTFWSQAAVKQSFFYLYISISYTYLNCESDSIVHPVANSKLQSRSSWHAPKDPN